jgi:hypothetical protein
MAKTPPAKGESRLRNQPLSQSSDIRAEHADDYAQRNSYDEEKTDDSESENPADDDKFPLEELLDDEHRPSLEELGVSKSAARSSRSDRGPRRFWNQGVSEGGRFRSEGWERRPGAGVSG